MSSLVRTQSQVGVQPLAPHAQYTVGVRCCHHHDIQWSSRNWWHLSQSSAETTI